MRVKKHWILRCRHGYRPRAGADGDQFFVAPLFNGLMLVTAVGLSLTTARRREEVAAAANLAESANGR